MVENGFHPYEKVQTCFLSGGWIFCSRKSCRTDSKPHQLDHGKAKAERRQVRFSETGIITSVKGDPGHAQVSISSNIFWSICLPTSPQTPLPPKSPNSPWLAAMLHSQVSLCCSLMKAPIKRVLPEKVMPFPLQTIKSVHPLTFCWSHPIGANAQSWRHAACSSLFHMRHRYAR